MSPEQTALQRFRKIITCHLIGRFVYYHNGSIINPFVGIEISDENIPSSLSTYTLATLYKLDGARVVLFNDILGSHFLQRMCLGVFQYLFFAVQACPFHKSNGVVNAN